MWTVNVGMRRGRGESDKRNGGDGDGRGCSGGDGERGIKNEMKKNKYETNNIIILRASDKRKNIDD